MEEIVQAPYGNKPLGNFPRENLQREKRRLSKLNLGDCWPMKKPSERYRETQKGAVSETKGGEPSRVSVDWWQVVQRGKEC